VCVSARLNAIKREARHARVRSVARERELPSPLNFQPIPIYPRLEFTASRGPPIVRLRFLSRWSGPRVSGRHKSPRTSGRESSGVASSTSARRGRENRLLSYGDTLIITHANELYESSPAYEHGSSRICVYGALRKASERIRRERGAKEAANPAKTRDCLS